METDNFLGEMVSVIKGRAAFYEFFSAALRGPVDQDFIEIAKQFAPHFLNIANEIGTDDLKKGAELFSDFVAKINKIKTDADMEQLISKLNMSYTSLFLLGTHSVPTAESVYLSPERILKQEPWEDVVRVYSENNFGMPVDFKETEDHVSIETLFMCVMSVRTVETVEKSDQAMVLSGAIIESMMKVQGDFITNHMQRWIPEFCDRVYAKCVSSKEILLYDGVALLLKGFLAYDAELITSIVSE